MVASVLRGYLMHHLSYIDRSHIYLLTFQTIMHAGSQVWSHNWHDHISWEGICDVDHCFPAGKWHQNSLWNGIKCSHILTLWALSWHLVDFHCERGRIYALFEVLWKGLKDLCKWSMKEGSPYSNVQANLLV